MDRPPQIRVTKLDAARRQLRTAIELWAADGDPVSIHSLAFAAHQIVHDLKHADSRTRKKGRKEPMVMEIDFSPETNELFMFITIDGLKHLVKNLTEIEIAFYTWHSIQRPDLLNDAGREAFENGVPTDVINSFRSMKKQEFLERAIHLIRGSN